MPNNNKDIYNYKKAKLVLSNKDNKPFYYIDFSAYDTITGKLKRKRISHFNNIENLKQREQYGLKLTDEINNLLIKGFHFNKIKLDDLKKIQKLKENDVINTIETSLNTALEIKKHEISTRTYNTYNSILNIFNNFLDRHGLRHDLINNLTKDVALSFQDYLLIEKELNGKTINDNIGALRSLCNTLIERNIINNNPFSKLKRQKVIQSKRNFAFTTDEIKVIKEHLKKNDDRLLNFCLFIFYSFMRPNEIRQLKLINIDLENKIIYVPAKVSKTKCERYVYISDELTKVIKYFIKNIDDKESYIITNSFKNSYKPIGVSTMTNKHREVLEKLNIRHNKTLYSWKHTGNVIAYKRGVDIYSLMKQNGHTSINTTMNYLKSLGLIMDKELTVKFESIKI